jgi:RNA polymerase sigma-70 factor (ECF subfamily)
VTPASVSPIVLTGAPPPGPIDSADLGELLRRSGLGDQGAFAEVYDRTAALLFGMVVAIVRDPALSERAAQAAYLAVWRRSSRFDPARGGALAWILTIAHGAAVKGLGSEPRRRPVDRGGSGLEGPLPVAVTGVEVGRAREA